MSTLLIFLTRVPIFDSMGVGKQRNISLNPWIKDAVEELAKREGKSFPSIVNQLLTIQLELEGFSEGAYITKQRGRTGGQIPDVAGSRPTKAG
jgi:hypothetical protein